MANSFLRRADARERADIIYHICDAYFADQTVTDDKKQAMQTDSVIGLDCYCTLIMTRKTNLTDRL